MNASSNLARTENGDWLNDVRPVLLPKASSRRQSVPGRRVFWIKSARKGGQGHDNV
jgi:hypothetical protein